MKAGIAKDIFQGQIMLVAALLLNYTPKDFVIILYDICISELGKHGLNVADN